MAGLDLHHLTYRYGRGEEPDDALIPVCRECHDAIHGELAIRRGRRDRQVPRALRDLAASDLAEAAVRLDGWVLSGRYDELRAVTSLVRGAHDYVDGPTARQLDEVIRRVGYLGLQPDANRGSAVERAATHLARARETLATWRRAEDGVT